VPAKPWQIAILTICGSEWLSTPLIQHGLKVGYDMDMSLSLLNNRLSILCKQGLLIRKPVPQPSGGYEFHYKETE